MVVVVNAVAVKMGGAANGLRALLDELKKRADRPRFVFFVGSSQAERGTDLPTTIQWRVTSAGERGWFRRLWWDQVGLRRELRREQATVLFSFSDFAMLRCPIPQLLFVRNPLPYSERFQRQLLPGKGWGVRLRYRGRRWLAYRSVAAADAVMTPSRSMLEMLQRAVPLPEGKAIVNYYGAPARSLPPVPGRTYDGAIRMLFPTYYAEHKNFVTALEALRLLRQRQGNRFQLVSTADPLWKPAPPTGAREHELSLLDELRQQGAVEILGVVPPDRLAHLYAECHVMCYPTLTESFGHPLMEALAAGLPVAASDIPVNRELARDAALYFSPDHPEQLADCIQQVVNQPETRARLQERGRRYAQEFSWARHTEVLVRRLEILAGSRADP